MTMGWKKKPLTKHRPTENIEYLQLCKWFKVQYPTICFITDLIGMKLPPQVAKRLSMMRSDKMPDMFIAYPNCGYCGLFIEFKRTDANIYKQDGSLRSNEHVEQQVKVIEGLQKRGYYAAICIGIDDAMKLINDYMSCKVPYKFIK